MIKIDVVIPVYNGERYLVNTVFSVLNQDYAGFNKLIIVNDNSRDQSHKICSSLKVQFDNKIIYHCNDENIGLMRTNNIALEYCTADFILFLGQDDILQPSHLRLMADCASIKKDSLVWCNSIVIDADGAYQRKSLIDYKQKLKSKMPLIFLKKANFISSTGAIINKHCLIKNGGWPLFFKNYGEWLLWIVLSNVGNINYCTKTVAYYRRHDSNMSAVLDFNEYTGELKEYFKLCRNEAKKYF